MPLDRPKSWLALAGWLALTSVAALLGGIASSRAGDFYLALDRPAWAPPSWLFGPVWTVLYVVMGVAAWLVWRKAGWRAGRRPLGLFLVQLALNVLWSVIFFGWERPGLALAEIVLLWIAIAATALSFRKLSRPAAGLLLPYLAWVTFAISLNAGIWWLNRG